MAQKKVEETKLIWSGNVTGNSGINSPNSYEKSQVLILSFPRAEDTALTSPCLAHIQCEPFKEPNKN